MKIIDDTTGAKMMEGSNVPVFIFCQRETFYATRGLLTWMLIVCRPYLPNTIKLIYVEKSVRACRITTPH